jgi:O-antigen ligase/tetratricopeptide (TPR) repeat protein
MLFSAAFRTNKNMASPASRLGKADAGRRLTFRSQVRLLLQITMEAVLLIMILFSPWAYGSEPAGFEFLLDAGVSLLVVLWGFRMLLEGELAWKKCSVTLCLAGLFLLGAWQLTPLDHGLLSTISPATERLYERLLPATSEQLALGEPNHVIPPASSTISLYPHVTQIHLQRILTVFLVFAVVRNNLGSSASLHRLGMAALINGAFLSLFAFLQYFSSPPDVLYWSYPSGGRVFGPFIYRNHFACYVNLCIGLGFGMLWSRRFALEGADRKQTTHLAQYSSSQSDRGFQAILRRWRDWVQTPLGLLHDTASLWICVALALMVSSVVFSLSRGGFLALVGGLGTCLLIRMSRSHHFLRLGAVWLSLALAVGLLGWFGLARIETRLTSLLEGKALQESRLPLWSSVLTIVKDFPVWGTGYGTYQYVDPLYRTSAEFAVFNVDHVHNDYLELLVEGGLVGLLLYLVAIGLVFRFGYRDASKGRLSAGLALGALFALTTLVIHSLGDFDIHVPAITLLGTVLCAQIASLGDPDGGSLQGQSVRNLKGNTYTLRWGGMAPVFAALICTALGWIVFGAGWRLHETDSLRRQAFRAAQGTAPGRWERKKGLLEAALRLTPHDAGLRTQLGELYADMFRHRNETLGQAEKAGGAAETVVFLSPCGLPLGPAQPVFTGLSSLEAITAVHRIIVDGEKKRLESQYLLPALESFLQARNRSPLLPGPHLGLALHAQSMGRADPFSVYMARVQLLAPSDPTFWYFCGNQELFHNHSEHAWKSWRRCLELSDRYFPLILERGAKLLGHDRLLRDVLPDKPGLLFTAAFKLYSRTDATEERKPFLDKALALLERQSGTLSLEDLHLKAMLQKHLGYSVEALGVYKTLLARDPLQITWRYEFAQLLYEERRLAEARTELLAVLAQKPRHVEAYELLTTVTRELLKRR